VGEERNSYFYYGLSINLLWMHFVDTDITGLER
jgi:hypothetical protein